jgi:hypothetical protein
MTISFEVKSQLAKLLATENITMQHNPSAKTASFDIKSRHLTLPVWQNISEDLYDMLVVHEVGHALDTPLEGWLEAIEEIAAANHSVVTDSAKFAVKDYLNIIEDARIDKRQKRRYPGSRINYIRGYNELHEKDFFGVKTKDINSMSLIDRINIHYKSGSIFNKISFSQEEKEFIKQIDNAETFKDVVEIVKALYAFAKDNQNKTDSNYDKIEIETSVCSESDSDESDDSEDFDDEDFDDDESDDDAPTMLIVDEEEDFNDDSFVNTGDRSQEEQIPKSETEEAARVSNSVIVADQNMDYIYYTIPEFNIENIADDFSIVVPQMEMSVKASFNSQRAEDSSKTFQKMRNRENNTITFLVKEFEMKKAADAYARTSISKTGIIDTNKIYTYKYNDDIFRKTTNVPEGKNHGFVMLLDWSGSMIDNLIDTITQLACLVFFCKRVGVPFEVYIFRDPCISDGKLKNQYTIKDPNAPHLAFDSVKLRNVLSSRMSNDMLHRAFRCLWFRADLNSDPMNGTPLNQAILSMDKLVNHFKVKNKLQVVNTIILTDGVGDNSWKRGTNYTGKKRVEFIIDPVTKKTYSLNMNNRHKETQIYLSILKERTGTNLIGYFVYRGSLGNLSYMIDYTILDNKDIQKKWRNEGFLQTNTCGYDQHYIMNVNNLSQMTNNQIVVTPDMTKKQIMKHFSAINEKKATSRVMLRSFIDHVAKPAA